MEVARIPRIATSELGKLGCKARAFGQATSYFNMPRLPSLLNLSTMRPTHMQHLRPGDPELATGGVTKRQAESDFETI
jgi:hypothetical protein